jgi:Flp pilus assembly protein TadG
MRLRSRPRGAATTVECAVVYPVTFLFVVGLLVGSMGMFRYQQIATLAREASRYAAVHGTQYAKDAKVPAPTPADIFAAAVEAKAVGLDLGKMTYSITYDTNNAPSHMNIVSGNVTPYGNTVTVTLNYVWVPEAYLGGITLTSTSQTLMSY